MTTALPDQQHALIDRLPGRGPAFARLARWDRPIGTWLLLLPCWWGLALAPGWPSPWLALLFAVGAVAMRGAGCTINDLADREFDRKVERTRHRPLASGAVSAPEALAFLAAQMLVGLAVLVQLRPEAILAGFLAVPLVVIYPFMKRVTYWPQAFLGLTFNWGVWVGYVEATGGIDAAALALYAAGIAWTLGYDTIYAHQDKEDDVLVGVKSSALRLGARTKPALVGFFATTLALLALAGALAGARPLFYAALVPIGVFLWRQVRRVDLDDAGSCLAAFRAHRGVGLAVVAALLLGKLW